MSLVNKGVFYTDTTAGASIGGVRSFRNKFGVCSSAA